MYELFCDILIYSGKLFFFYTIFSVWVEYECIGIVFFLFLFFIGLWRAFIYFN